MYAAALEFSWLDWRYEPNEFAVGDYIPDFAVTIRNRPGRKNTLIIEYKPARVTGAYLERLAEKFQQLEDQGCETLLAIYNWFGDDANAAFTMFHGELEMLVQLDFMTSERSSFIYDPYRPGWLTPEIIEQVKQYRFDLLHGEFQ
jgi:hypothetical protein